MGIVEGALVVGALSTVGSLVEGAEARSDQRKAQRAQQRIQERKLQRERIKAIREQRIQQGLLGVQAANTGTQNTSAVQGAGASLTQNLANNLGFVNQIQGLQQTVQARMEDASRHQANAALFGGVASLATQFASASAPTGGGNNPVVSEALGSSQAGYSSTFVS